jgi:F-type H+-transporting ATPase subunit b
MSDSTEPVESDIISLEDSPDGETHTSVGIDGEEHVVGVFPPFDSTTFASQLLWVAITFAALYFIMSRVALPRIGEILEVRRDRIEGDLAEADRLRQKTDQAIASYEAALADARAKAHGIAEATREEIKSDLATKRSKVESELAKKVSAAEVRIEETKVEALGHVDEIAADTAQALVAQLVGKVPIKAARDAVAKVSKE